MKPDEPEIERLLRRAPKPSPPAELKAKLQAAVGNVRSATKSVLPSAASGGWLRRWWPVLVPAAASLVCAVAVAVQQLEIQDLKASLQRLTRNFPTGEANSAESPAGKQESPRPPHDPAAAEQQEIDRLKALVAQLGTEIADLARVQQENETLRAKLVEPPMLSPEEVAVVNDAKERAMSIACVNNLKQIGLAVRIWAGDNGEMFPPDFLTMSNELSTPKILVCRADTSRVAVDRWQAFTAANCSYEYLAASASDGANEPTRVLTRCPIHGHVGLCDGSVQSEVAKKHPDWLKERDGKLYLER